MATSEEIRARVKAADEARISVRADRAALVAEIHGRRAAALQELKTIEIDFAASVRAAAEVMSVDELAEFSLVPRTELPVKPRPARTAVRAGSPRKKRTASSAASAREADQPAGANR